MIKTLPLAATAAAFVVAGCETTETIQFTSKQEEACYNQVTSGLGPNKRLERDRNGVFVVVTSTSGFVRDVDQSPEFDACMVQNQVPGSGGDQGTITFTPAEQAIWDSLSDASRKDALEFIRNGGTLTEFSATL